MGTDPEPMVARLLQRYGTTFAREAGISLPRETPSGLFRLLCASMLWGSRISAQIGTRAARALFDHGWGTPRGMSRSSWSERTMVLNRAGYARYDESTSRRLGDMATSLLADYQGDLRRLRQRAGRRPDQLRTLLTQFTGVGPVSVDIFFREVQGLWSELYPFADQRALSAAQRLGLPAQAPALARLVAGARFPELLAALVRVDLAKDFASVTGQP
ncbi:MAG: hypothetical protein ACREOD_02160 [Candidatus Dormibacteria bacterium]